MYIYSLSDIKPSNFYCDIHRSKMFDTVLHNMDPAVKIAWFQVCQIRNSNLNSTLFSEPHLYLFKNSISCEEIFDMSFKYL